MRLLRALAREGEATKRAATVISMSDLDVELDPVEQRILASLLEKQRTVPTSYPMSLNALRNACNQTSNRDPVVDYDDEDIKDGIGRLKSRELVRVVWSGRGARVLKYHQLLDERLSLQPEERALLTVLLLRGAQSVGELKTRTERLHAFGDRDTVDARLRAMAELSTPLVRELERGPGQQERRWIHLLGPVPEVATAPTEPAVDRDAVLADGMAARDAKLVAGYDVLAVEYADRLVDELEHKPFDRWLLDRVAELAGAGPIADVGSGPGNIAGRLASAGADVFGFDLSPGMVDEARRRFPDVQFEVADLTRLLRPRTSDAWGAITAWYALVHLAGSELAPAVDGLARVLRPGGWLALAVHVGHEVRHVDEMWGLTVDLDFVLHDRTAVLAAVRGGGLVDVEWYLRGPYPKAEVETDRLYVLARKPA